VAAYRLIGYENRTLAARDFRDDNKDAGEIGAGHSVTAFYEVVPPGREIPDGDIPPLKYQSASRADVDDDLAGELMNVRLRYKLPSQDQGTEFVHSVSTDVQPFQKASDDFRFGAAVTGFGMLVRRSSYAEPLDWRSIRQWAGGAIGRDANGYRTEFLDLVSHAEQLIPRTPRAPREVTRAVSPSLPIPSPSSAQVEIRSSEASVGGNQVGPRDLVVLLILIAACSLISILQKHTSPITDPSELPS
ncbi:MAG: DUF3520 domain-containing protein, partial [Planctomycetaceae bacterium]|nr:DUF3520 domain-containing protein [Planctomycetaceae bacterium]